MLRSEPFFYKPFMSAMIKTILGTIGTAIATLSALLIVVDGVTIILTYVSLLKEGVDGLSVFQNL